MIDDQWVQASLLPNAGFFLACPRDFRGLYLTRPSVTCPPAFPPALNPDNLLYLTLWRKSLRKSNLSKAGSSGLTGRQTSSLQHPTSNNEGHS